MRPTILIFLLYKFLNALWYKAEGRGFEIQLCEYIFPVYLPAALGPEVYSACTKNEYQNQKNNVSGSRARSVRRAENLTTNYQPIV
jgi:hypothetical protein